MTTTITPMMLKALRADVDAALAPIRAKFDLSSLRLGKCSYDPGAGTFTYKVEGVAQGAKGKEAALYESPSAKFLGLPPLGFEFTQAGRKYKTSGLNTTGSKVICERDDGGRFLFKVDDIKRRAGTQT